MTFYTSQSYRQDQVSIGSSDLDLLQSISIDSDVRDSKEHWVSEAQRREDILYFSIFLDRELLGQMRGHGYGTKALYLLQSYVLSHTLLKKLVIITSRDNLASQRLALKCGFQYVGASREDPVNDMVFEWHVPLNSR